MRNRAKRSLPPYATTWFGRESDLDAVEDLLRAGHHVVTLTGVAGVGKTRLASEIARARQVASSTPWDVCICDLSRAREVTSFLDAFADACGIARDDLAPIKPESLGQALAERGPCLIVLDNFEQLVPSSAGSLAEIVHAAPEAVFLVTSRERLGIEAERAYLVEPLPVPEEQAADLASPTITSGVQLFVDRAQLTRPDFSVDDVATRRDVFAIVRMLDGIPLALELCAARVGVLGARQLRDLLAHGLDLLEGSSAIRGERHATLRGALDWSWSLLDEEERLALGAMSIFEGSFSLEAATSLLDTTAAQALRWIQSLHDKSLLVARDIGGDSGARSYRLLETVRELASEKLVAMGRAEQLRDRHAAFFHGEALLAMREARSEGSAGPRASSTRSWLAACDWLLEREGSAERAADIVIAADALSVTGATLPFVSRLERLLHTLDPQSPRAQQTRVILGRLLLRSRWDAGVAHLEAALESGALPAEDRAGALAVLGHVRIFGGRFAEGEALFTEAVALARETRNERVEGCVHHYRGIGRIHQGRAVEARADFEVALGLMRASGAEEEEAFVLSSFGNLALKMGDLDRADEAYGASLRLFDQGDRQDRRSTLMVNMAALALERGEHAQARAMITRSLERMRAGGDRRGIAIGLVILGEAELEERNERGAAAVLADAALRLERLHLSSLRAWALALWASAEALDGRPVEAARRLDLGESILASIGGGAEREALSRIRCVVDLALAASAEPVEARRLFAGALARHDATIPDEVMSEDVRFAQRLLARTISDVIARGHGWARPPGALLIEERGAWFHLDEGARVDLGTRRPLARLLARMLEGRLRRPGEAIAPDALISAAWQGERIQRDAALARLHVAISTLRKLGLEHAVERTPRGYLLASAIPVYAVRTPPPAPTSS